jgi:hypothetical protein
MNKARMFSFFSPQNYTKQVWFVLKNNIIRVSDKILSLKKHKFTLNRIVQNQYHIISYEK